MDEIQKANALRVNRKIIAVRCMADVILLGGAAMLRESEVKTIVEMLNAYADSMVFDESVEDVFRSVRVEPA